MRLVFDIEATNLLGAQSLDYSKYPYKLKEDFKVHCVVFKDIDSGEVIKLYEESLTEENVKEILNRADTLIAHNGIMYDLPVLSLYFNVGYSIGSGEEEPSTLMGRDCHIFDTLLVSRMLWPDRPSGHSLKEWGKRMDFYKGSYGEQDQAWDEFSIDMLEYCEQDVEVTEKVYAALLKEWGEWDWWTAFWMEQAIADIVFRQEHFGFSFDIKRAEEALEDLNTRMKDIENRVEPLLPAKPMSKTNAKYYIPPKIQIKRDGTVAANMIKFVDKMNGEIVEDEYGDKVANILGESYKIPMEQKPVRDTEPMLMANQKDMKEYLVRLGWRPTVWADNDLAVDSKKKAVSDEKYKASVIRYCEETQKSSFKPFRLAHRKVKTVQELYNNLIKAKRDRPVKVITSPKYVVDDEKNLCPDLERLGSKVEFVQDVAYWLTYRHRRNSILSPKGTGFLAQPRIRVDSRIQTPAITCGAATSRMQHKICANIPRPTSMYGAPMRDLFTVTPGTYQIGCDAAGLEARVEAHYTMRYPGGVEYSQALISEKPNDIHSVTARKMEVTRDVAKTLKYAVSYGAQPPKLAKQMDWPISKAQGVFEDFWEAAGPLKILKEKVVKYWKTKGQGKFIKGIDGRKLYARSEHSILNLLFQSCGVIIMKKAAVLLDRDLRNKGQMFDPFKDSSFEGKACFMIQYHDEYQLQVSKELVERLGVFDDEESAKDFEIKDKRMSDLSHVEDKVWKGYSEVGVSMSKAIKDAAEFYGMKVPFGGDYQIGTTWRHCH